MTNKRTIEQLRDQYEIEKEYSNRIRHANKDERPGLYSKVYDAFFRTAPSHHTQLRKKESRQTRKQEVEKQLHQLQGHLKPESTFLDIGAGDCALSFEVARYVNKVYAVDVSDEIIDKSNVPENVEIIISDGISLPVEKSSVDIAYSNQLIEHLHPDDGQEHIHNVYRALKPGGIYLAITPNRINGPHDISKYFDESATGFHLKEYTINDLYRSFKAASFKSVKKVFNLKGYIVITPLWPFLWMEKALFRLPFQQRRALSSKKPLHFLLYLKLLGIK